MQRIIDEISVYLAYARIIMKTNIKRMREHETSKIQWICYKRGREKSAV